MVRLWSVRSSVRAVCGSIVESVAGACVLERSNNVHRLPCRHLTMRDNGVYLCLQVSCAREDVGAEHSRTMTLGKDSIICETTQHRPHIHCYYAMPAGEALDDDYVASLLKKDAEAAEANKNRYLTSGLGSLLSRKPKGNAPKPNTRFLRNIIRETDSHNAALKAREEGESKVRLRELRGDDRGGKRRREEEPEEEPEDVRPKERRRDDERPEKRRRDGDRPDRWANALGGLDRAERSHRHHEHPSSRDEHGGRSKHRHRKERDGPHEHRYRSKATVPEPMSRPRTRSPEYRTKRRRRHSNGSDSDPLESVIGPAPPPKVHARGRGAVSNSSMDERFRPDYDPKTDVHLDQDEEDDWDMALEALRDRTKWRQQGAERLKAAGFTDDEVRTWETGGEKDVEDVQWRKKGEDREWDRGKSLDGGGGVTSKAEWAKSRDP